MENWKEIPSTNGMYLASDLGNIKSIKFGKDKILKPAVNSTGRLNVVIIIDNKAKSVKVHQLVAMAFLGHKQSGYNLVIDHINSNPLDNRLENIRIVTHRFNVSKDIKNKTSKYTGVYFNKSANKYQATIRVNGKKIHLGVYSDEYDAHLAYKKYLNGL